MLKVATLIEQLAKDRKQEFDHVFRVVFFAEKVSFPSWKITLFVKILRLGNQTKQKWKVSIKTISISVPSFKTWIGSLYYNWV